MYGRERFELWMEGFFFNLGCCSKSRFFFVFLPTNDGDIIQRCGRKEEKKMSWKERVEETEDVWELVVKKRRRGFCFCLFNDISTPYGLFDVENNLYTFIWSWVTISTYLLILLVLCGTLLINNVLLWTPLHGRAPI